nr:unnamed protein product [Callosobruchus chinensis]
MLYKAQIRPSLEQCSHIWGAAAHTALSILDAVQRRAIRLIGDPALTCHLQPLPHRRAVGDLSLFYRYSNGFCSSKLTSIIPPLSIQLDAHAELLLLTPRRSSYMHQEPNDIIKKEVKIASCLINESSSFVIKSDKIPLDDLYLMPLISLIKAFQLIQSF